MPVSMSGFMGHLSLLLKSMREGTCIELRYLNSCDINRMPSQAVEAESRLNNI
jgi:hypothetical protein